MMSLKSFKSYLNEDTSSVYFTFGRMNPPHVGHGKVLESLSRKAGSSKHFIFVSQSQDTKKNPLQYKEKVKYLRNLFPKSARNIIYDKKVRKFFDAVTYLYEKGFSELNLVVGSDQINSFTVLLEKYNGVKGRHGFYNFEKINVISAGTRDPDSESSDERISATEMRNSAKENNFRTFSMGLPKNTSDSLAKNLFNDVRRGMGLSEETNFNYAINFKPVSSLREKYVTGDLFAIGDLVESKKTGFCGIIEKLGANHILIRNKDNQTTSLWIEDVKVVEAFDTPAPAMDPVSAAKEKIKRERQSDKSKHDKMISQAKIKAVRMARNKQKVSEEYLDEALVARIAGSAIPEISDFLKTRAGSQFFNYLQRSQMRKAVDSARKYFSNNPNTKDRERELAFKAMEAVRSYMRKS